jgi:cobalt-zinc-cadmium efflux system membrane fusion protein
VKSDFRVYALLVWLLFSVGCASKKSDPAAEAPPAPQVEQVQNDNIVKVDQPNDFPLVTATEIDAASTLNATGSVSPDVARQVPAISLASGRAIEIFARLGDSVAKGQLLMRVQSSDITNAYSDYQKAVVDERLARSQFERAQDLKQHGAIAQKDLDVFENAEAEAKVTVNTTAERLHVLGADIRNPSSLVDVRSPISGVITEQNISAGGPVKTLDNSPNLFTVTDLSEVWVLCDVYENGLPQVRLGEFADIHITAYPDVVLKGRISDIGPVLDPALRTAKVRLQVHNPGMLRFGMFVTATFHGLKKEVHAAVPASAVLHLHDHDWVYVPETGGRFRRVAVVGGPMLGNLQEIESGLEPGQKVVGSALVLQNTVEQ